MNYYQQHKGESIDEFIHFIEDEFWQKYPWEQNYLCMNFEAFRQSSMISCLLNGMNKRIKWEMPNNILNYKEFYSWDQVIHAVKVAEYQFEMKKNNGMMARMSLSSGGLHSITFQLDHQGYVNCFTDGACPSNGRYIRAGFGIWFGQGHPLNCKGALDRSKDVLTNNAAEIRAVIEAIKIVQKYGYARVAIFTDSKYLVDSMTKWIYKWQRNGWLNCKNQPVKNRKQFMELHDAAKNIHVKWIHVMRGSCEGNINADKLAKEAANCLFRN